MDISDLIGKQRSGIESDEIQTEFSSLYIRKTSESIEVELSEEHSAKFGGILALPIEVEVEEYILYYSSFMHEEADQDEVIEKLSRANGACKLIVRIDSYGGDVSEGIKLLGVIQRVFKGRITTEVLSNALSMGALLFAAGDKRVAYEFSALMFHTGHTGAQGTPLNAKNRLDFETKIVDKLDRKYVNKYFTESEIRDMRIGEDKWIDAEEMCYRGIATHVIVDNVELTAEEYVDYIDSYMSIEEWVEQKILLEDDEMSEENFAELLESLGLSINDTEEDEDASTD